MNYNSNLITIKCVLFAFFGGVGCLLPFLPIHMLQIGLNFEEARIISIVAPCVALFGPLLMGPLADKLAGSTGSGGGKQTQTGRYLRVMIAITFILGAVFYLLLMAVPSVARFEARRPSVTFSCNGKGGEVLQERCTEEKKCHHWDEEKVGSLLLSNCRYACPKPPVSSSFIGGSKGENETNTTINTVDSLDLESESEGDYDSGYDTGSGNEAFDINNSRRKRQPNVKGAYRSEEEKLEPAPHLCYKELNGVNICQIYTGFSEVININITLHHAINEEANDEEWCTYPVGGDFSCRIYPEVIHNPAFNSCQPVIECDVEDPYDAPNSVLAESQCVQTVGDPALTFWLYLVLRSIADIFPTAGLALLDAAIVIATRETSSGRGDVGKQFAWGALGLAIFAPLVGLQEPFPACSAPIICYAILMVIAAVIILFSKQMPLSPPEWWWHTRCGMLAVPMSAVKQYGFETGALLVVLMLLGTLWSTIDSYLPWYLEGLEGSYVLIGLTITIGALLSIPLLWYAERIVDYCGHSNILITAFAVYIIRYTGLSFLTSPWWSLLLESLEVFTLILMWVTAILYLRHLVPRRYTVTGQASAVVMHFCLGRCIGAIIGGVLQSKSILDSLRFVYQVMAVLAAIIAMLYFDLYHFYLKPRCTAPTAGPPRQPPTIMQGMNANGTNGTYTPLRVYHNGRARKGQFRY